MKTAPRIPSPHPPRPAPLRRVVVVGHGIAGLTAGQVLRREGFDGELVVVGQESHAPYSRPALSKSLAAADHAPGPAAPAELEPPYLAGTLEDAEVLSGVSAAGLCPERSAVMLDDGRDLAYDGLVITSGASPHRFSDSPDELTLRSLDDARTLYRRLAAQPSVVVLGGGPLGMEVASSARALGCQVTLVHRGLPMHRQVGAALARICTSAALDHGLVHRDAAATAVRAPAEDAPRTGSRTGVAGRGLTVELSDGGSLTADLVVTAVGDVPNTVWLQDSGLLTDGRLITCPRGTVAPGVVAAGDVSWRSRAGGPFRRALWTDAIEEATAAAAALLHGEAAAAPDFTPYFWTEQFGLSLRLAGFPHPEAEPVIVDGDPAAGRALFRWEPAGDTGPSAAAALNYRIPIPRLRRLAAPASVAA